MPRHNSLGQPIGEPVLDWKPVPYPPRAPLEGRTCRLEALDLDRHAAALFEADAEDRDHASWTYLPYGPFPTLDDYRRWMVATCLGEDPQFWAILDRASARPVGVASLLRIDPKSGVAEVGHIHYSPSLQRTALATEAMFLLMQRVFDLGYRRYEWKCDALNAASRRAATRLGFTYEGTFRNARVYKERSRDTAWFAIVDREWPALRAAFEAWLVPSNFDADGRQRRALADLTAAALR